MQVCDTLQDNVPTTKVLCLMHMVTEKELVADDEYEGLFARKF